MFRTANLMMEKEQELDYLCRLDITDLPTDKPSTEVSKLLVDFILRHDLDLNGQKGSNYVTFREFGAEQSLIGGFGSRQQISEILINENFKVKEHTLLHKNKLIELYSKIDFCLAIKEECVTYSLKKDYEKLEDVEYVDFVYNLDLTTDKDCFYPESKVIVRHYFDEVAPSFSIVDREDLDIDLVITLTTSITNFNAVLPAFINYHKESFCSKLGIDIEGFDNDTNTLVEMMII